MALSITNNIASLTAQHNLNRTSSALGKSLERLSSGLKINRGADGPAALVISEQQRAQIAGLQTAIDNTSKAVSLVQTGEGALNEINALLVKIRGLALDSANSGVNDTNALAANQAEINNALASIDRIANTTQFGTKKLLDGSSAAQAVLGTTGATNIDSVTAGANTIAGTYQIAVTQQGQKAQLQAANVFAAATNSVTASSGTAITGSPTATNSTQTGTYSITVTQQGVRANITNAAGATGLGAGETQDLLITGTGLGAGVTVNLTNANGSTVGDQRTAIQGALDAAAGAGVYTVGGAGGTITISRAAFGTANAVNVQVTGQTGSNGTGFASNVLGTQNGTAGAAVQVQISGGNLSSPISVSGSGASGTTIDVNAGISSIAQGLNFTVANSGFTTAAVGSTGSVTVSGSASLTLGSGSSAVTFNLDAQNSSTINDLVNTINAETETTGVTASANGAFLVLTANRFGGSNFAFSATGASSGVVNGQGFALNAQDLQARIYDADGNLLGGTITGAGANGDVITATSSSSVSFGDADGLSFDLAAQGTSNGVSGIQTAGVPSSGQYTASVTLTDSLVFQIGANQSQTASVSIQKVTSDQLGKNVAGLTNSATDSLNRINVTTSDGAQDALAIIDQAINDITSLRGKLGAFQTNTLESTANNLRTTLENTVAAESVIRDTDFAAETAAFTKNQVLIQAGTTVLSNANATAQLVLSLLGGR